MESGWTASFRDNSFPNSTIIYQDLLPRCAVNHSIIVKGNIPIVHMISATGSNLAYTKHAAATHFS